MKLRARYLAIAFILIIVVFCSMLIEDYVSIWADSDIPLQELLVDQSDFSKWDEPKDIPNGATTAVFPIDGAEDIVRQFSEPNMAWQYLWHYPTTRRASGAFHMHIDHLLSENPGSPFPEDLERTTLHADEYDVFCAVLPSMDFDLCYFVGQYNSYVTTFAARIDQKSGGTVTYDDFRQMVYAVDKKMSHVMPTPTP